MIEFKEIKKNRFGRRWGIKINGKIEHKGYDFKFGKELYTKLNEVQDEPITQSN